MRGDPERLADILEAIDRIEKYASMGREYYLANELVQGWMFYHIQMIGEAASNLSKDIRRRHSHVPWADIIAMRNVIVHQYFGVDLEEVWDTIVIDLPLLKSEIQEMLRRIASS